MVRTYDDMTPEAKIEFWKEASKYWRRRYFKLKENKKGGQ